jgi:hypothetical protein
MKPLGLLAGLALGLVTNPTSGQVSFRWTVLTMSRNALLSYDSTTIKKLGAHMYEVWFRTDPAAPDTIRTSTFARALYSHSLALYRIDCQGRRLSHITTTYYDSSGSVLHTEERTDVKWSYVLPESVGESMVRQFCATYEQREPPTSVWLVAWGSSRDRLTPLRLVVPEGEPVAITSAVHRRHTLTIDTLALTAGQKQSVSLLFEALPLERTLDEGGKEWTILGLPAGVYHVFCEDHPSSPLERLTIRMTTSPRNVSPESSPRRRPSRP